MSKASNLKGKQKQAFNLMIMDGVSWRLSAQIAETKRYFAALPLISPDFKGSYRVFLGLSSHCSSDKIKDLRGVNDWRISTGATHEEYINNMISIL